MELVFLFPLQFLYAMALTLFTLVMALFKWGEKLPLVGWYFETEDCVTGVIVIWIVASLCIATTTTLWPPMISSADLCRQCW